MYSNPWEVNEPLQMKTIDVGGMEEYYILAKSLMNVQPTRPLHRQLSQSPLRSIREGDVFIENPIIQKQIKLLELIDQCSEDASQLKAEQDIEKYGEFITRYEIQHKIAMLKRLSNHLYRCLELKDILVERICDPTAAHCLIVEEEYQKEFLNLIQLAYEESTESQYYNLLKQAAKPHANTIKKFQKGLENLSKAAQKCELMTQNFEYLRQVLVNLQDRYAYAVN